MLVRSLGCLMVLAVGLTAVACNTKHADSAGAPTTSVAQQQNPGSTSVPAAHVSTTTIPFSEAIDDVREQLQKASGNLCAMADATQKKLQATPKNATEVHEAIDLLAQMIRAMGTVAQSSDSAIYKATADELKADARKADYSVTWIQSAKSSEALNDKDFVAATSRLETKIQSSCKPTTSSPG